MNTYNRTEAIQATCPECQAAPGHPCTGSRGERRTAIHQERYQAAATHPTRELRSYDLGPIGKPDCTCEGIGFTPIEHLDEGITRWHPCPCRDNT